MMEDPRYPISVQEQAKKEIAMRKGIPIDKVDLSRFHIEVAYSANGQSRQVNYYEKKHSWRYTISFYFGFGLSEFGKLVVRLGHLILDIVDYYRNKK